MASPGNQHCASCIGTPSFPIRYSSLASSDSGLFDTAWRCCCCYSAPIGERSIVMSLSVCLCLSVCVPYRPRPAPAAVIDT